MTIFGIDAKKVPVHILYLLCGTGNKIFDKHFQVDFYDNSELILMKLSTFSSL